MSQAFFWAPGECQCLGAPVQPCRGPTAARRPRHGRPLHWSMPASLLSKYDPQKEAELRSWIEGLTGLSIGPDFQKGLKDGIILCTLMNKLQPGSVPKINRSMQNWHQLENLSNFIKAMVSYGMNPVDLFEANDLFESGNLTQVQVSLLALAGKAKTKGMQSGVDIGVKYSEKQERNFDDATMKAGQCVIGLQMGTNKCASQSGMTAYGTRRHLYDPKNHILPPMDHSTISLQMGTNKCASQVGMTAPGTRRHIYDTKLGTDKCDNSSMSLQMGYTQGANQSGQVFGLGRQIYDPKYCPQGPAADGAPAAAGDVPDPGEAPGYPPYYQEEAGY
ncbi:calponin-2 isoform X3 [Delphinapterus leucas]|uniref:Calponin n=1 Tax=Delphinapterus leucas TaxID=9749 RepID=A0A2Y9MW81_DELLE|nr:calponin-2 isoform X3 [Delphinapterus leucas]